MAADSGDTPKIVKVAEGFYVRQAVDNIAWVDLGDGALVVDALEQPELEAEVFAALAETLGDVPVRWVLNTHTHYDHVALNAAFQKRCGAEIVNQRTRRLGPDGEWFEGPRRRAHMMPMPGCHTDEDCVVWVPEDRALFVGDIFGWGLINLMGRLDDRAAQHLVDTHNRLIEYGADVVIPGHGPLCTTDELRRWVEYFEWLRATAGAGVAEGKSDSQIRQELAPPQDMSSWWRFRQWKHDDSVEKVLAAARHGRLS